MWTGTPSNENTSLETAAACTRSATPAPVTVTARASYTADPEKTPCVSCSAAKEPSERRDHPPPRRSTAWTATRRSGSVNGNGLNATAFRTAKHVVMAPMLSASVTTTMSVKLGCPASCRAATRRSRRKVLIAPTRTATNVPLRPADLQRLAG